MAYLFSFGRAQGTEMPVPPHANNDIIIAIYTQRFGGTSTPTASGWTEIFDIPNRNSSTGNVYWKKATSSSETIPNASDSAGNTEIGTVLVIRGANGTTPIAASAGATDNGPDYAAPSVTPTADNQLHLQLVVCGASNYDIYPDVGPIEVIRNLSTGQALHGVSYTYAGASAVATGTWPYHSEFSNSTGDFHYMMSILILDDTGDIRNGFVDTSSPPATLLHGLSYTGNSGDLTGTNKTFDPTSYIPTVTNVNTSFSDSTLYDAVDTASLFQFIPGISSASIENASVTTDILIAGSDFDASKDLSGQILSFFHRGGPRTPASKIGKIFGLTDKTNSRVWQIDGNNLTPNSEDQGIISVIEVDGGFEIDDTGTFDSTDCDALILGGEADPGSTGELTYGFLYQLGTMSVVGGTSTLPSSMTIAAAAAKTSALNSVQNQIGQTTTQFFVSQNVRIGNGSTQTYWLSDGQSISYPEAYDQDSLRIQFKLTENALKYSIKGSSTCTINLSGTSFNMGDFHGWEIESGADGSYDFNNCIVNKSTPVLNDCDDTITGLIIKGSREITYTTLADLSGGCTISDCTDAQSITINGATQAALQAEMDKLANCLFSGNIVALRIEFTGTGAVTLNFDAITFTSNTTDIHYNSTSTSALTANMQNGSNASTSAISGSATGVTISNDVTFTVNINVSGAELTILETGTQTEDHQVETSGTSEDFVFTAPLGHNVDIQVFKPGYETFWESNRDLGSADSSINVTLLEVPAYEA